MTQRRIYQNEYPYFVTFLTREGFGLFEKTKYAELLSKEIFVSSQIKRFDVLSYQIMPDHVHVLAYARTLEKVHLGSNFGHIDMSTERTLSSVRSDKKGKYTISDFMQSIKGNFSRKLHMGNIWQRRFYTRIINDRKYLDLVIYYIKQNPTKEKLPSKYHQLPYQYFDEDKINNLF